MEQTNSSIKKSKYTHLKESERYKIEVLAAEKNNLMKLL
jgi:hypothetical protein